MSRSGEGSPSAVRRRPGLVTRLASPRLAAWLMVGLAAYSALGFIVPQRAQLTATQYEEFEAAYPLLARAIDLAGLDSLYASVPMLALVALLAVNIAVCTWRRIARRPALKPVATFRPIDRARLPSGTGPEAAQDEARRRLGAAGWRVLVGEDSLVAVKGRGGFWGSVLLHVAMLVVVAGASWTALTSFGGTIVITEGQTVLDEQAAYTAITRLPRLGDAYTRAEIALESMEFEYEGDVAVRVVANVRGTTTDGRSARYPVRVNYPVQVGPKQYLLRDSGLAADISLVQGGRSERLVLALAEETPFGWQDALPLNGGSTLEVRVAPVPLGDGEMPARSLPASDPEMRVRLVTDGVPGSPATLYVGESISIDDTTLTFNAAPVWSMFLVRSSAARWLAYAGLWACVAGIAWRFLVPERRIAYAVVEEEGVPTAIVGYRSRPWLGTMWPGDAALVRRLLTSAAEERQVT